MRRTQLELFSCDANVCIETLLLKQEDVSDDNVHHIAVH